MPTQAPIHDSAHTSKVILSLFNSSKTPIWSPAAGPPPASVIALLVMATPVEELAVLQFRRSYLKYARAARERSQWPCYKWRSESCEALAERLKFQGPARPH